MGPAPAAGKLYGKKKTKKNKLPAGARATLYPRHFSINFSRA